MLSCPLLVAPLAAQSAFRCEQNGQTVYSDKPCPSSATSKAVAPTQDSAQQKAASQAATAQMRSDNADLDKLLAERQRREAKERAEARKAAGNAANEAQVQRKSKAAKAGAKAKAAKGSKKKPPGKSTRKKTKPGNSAVSATS